MTTSLTPENHLEETKRTSRILEIVQMIALHPCKYRRRDLAERFEVSERMIQKDLDIVRHDLRLSLCNDGEGYYFDQLPRLPTTAYSFTEALALLTAARAAQAVPGVNSAELAAAIARLETLFPADLRPMLRESTERLPVSAYRSDRQRMLAILHRGWIERRRIRITYATSSRAGELKERVVEPYTIIPYGRSWQLIAFDHLRKDVIQFKVDRVHAATLLTETYVIPQSFDLDAYQGDAWGIMRGAEFQPEDVVLLFEPEAGRWVAEELWHRSQQVETLADGSVRVRFHVGVTPEMVNWLLYYGARVRIMQPRWLREQVMEEHRRAAGMGDPE